LENKKSEGETIYTDMRDHLSTQEDTIMSAGESTNDFANHLGAQQRKIQSQLRTDVQKL
jgi:hypothetical protein